MNSNDELIHIFYKAFQEKDYKTMQQCYLDEAHFTDPIFINLDSIKLKAMWKMFCTKSNDLVIEYKNVKSNHNHGSAEWIAKYTFSRTGKTVTNTIYSSFIFENGKIIKQVDKFNFYKWSRQALGFTGSILGWSKLLKNKIRKGAIKSLAAFMAKD